MDVVRSRALMLACSVALEDEADGETVRRAQLFYDWMSGKFDVPIVYQIDEATPDEPDEPAVVPFKPRPKPKGH
jgi:hypothetical protein